MNLLLKNIFLCCRCANMAGVAQNVQVVSNSGESVVFEQDISASDLGFNINTSEDTSLQELIDSELALRISNTESEKITEPVTDNLIETFPVKTVHPITFQLEPDINEEFIFNEREHTSLQLNNYKNTENLITDDILNEQHDHLKSNTDILSESDIHLPDNTNHSDILVDESIEETGRIEVTSPENCPENIACQNDVVVDRTDTDEHIDSESQNIPSPAEKEAEVIDHTSDKEVDKPANIEIVIDEENVHENKVHESPKIIIETNCDVSEQDNKNIIVDVVENPIDVVDNNSDVVNNSMSIINIESVESVAVLKKVAEPEPEPLMSDDAPLIPSPTNNESHDILIKINGTAHSEDNDGFESWTTVEEATKPEENILEETKITVHITDDSEREQDSQESTEICESEISLVNDTKESELPVCMEESLEKVEDLTDGDNTAIQPKPALHECDTHTINNQTDSDVSNNLLFRICSN